MSRDPHPHPHVTHEVGIGLRREIADSIIDDDQLHPDFLEVSTENWIGLGGRWGKVLRRASERLPLTVHGLSLSLGSPDPLDLELLRNTKKFLREHSVTLFSEHLSFCSCDNVHLYDLLPIPFREDAVQHVVERIRQVQDFLERRIAVENISYYAPLSAELTEIEFLNAIVSESDCDLLLDLNNVHVNSRNHKYDSFKFLDALPIERVAGIHIAGHEVKPDGFIIDTHGAPTSREVYKLLEYITPRISRTRKIPILLERDFNLADIEGLEKELSTIRGIARGELNVT